MQGLELVLTLLVIAAGLAPLARRIGVPFPVVLVVGGLALALVPGLPAVDLAPDVVFLIFVPPLLFWAALTTSPRELRRNVRPIGFLAIGLVLVTAATVAAVAHAVVPGMPWGAAFVLGAVVSPFDAAAAISVARGLGVVPRPSASVACRCSCPERSTQPPTMAGPAAAGGMNLQALAGDLLYEGRQA